MAAIHQHGAWHYGSRDITVLLLDVGWVSYDRTAAAASGGATLANPGIEYLGGVLADAGYTVGVIQPPFDNVTVDELLSLIEESRPAVIGLSCMTCYADSTIEFAKKIRAVSPNSKLAVGGVGTLGEDRNYFAVFDGVFVGGWVEWVFLSWVSQGGPWKSEAIIPKPADYLKWGGEYDILPLRSLEAMRASRIREVWVGPDSWQVATQTFSERGCPNNCAFCASPGMWCQRVRHRDVRNVVEELHGLAEQGVNSVAINDLTFGHDARKTIDLCRHIAGAGISDHMRFIVMTDTKLRDGADEMFDAMSQAGVLRCSLGIEDPFCRDTVDKPACTVDDLAKLSATMWRYGLWPRAFLMMGMPGQTTATVDRLKTVLEAIRVTDLYVSICTPFPGTRLWEQTGRYSNLLPGVSRADFDTAHVVLRSPGMTPDKTLEARIELMRWFYNGPWLRIRHELITQQPLHELPGASISAAIAEMETRFSERRLMDKSNTLVVIGSACAKDDQYTCR